ncbi:alkene reductase [Phanerochaete sordida]|uniref:Alkene reductase n=1 Tax=Phanerochaete sordida TaxID=48140 RepID=A0A9P3FXV6_9APHY|nr:alkene reductase [Phanerochaete sordida]
MPHATKSSLTSHLSVPLALGDLSMRNRNVMASLTRNRSVPTNVPNDLNLEYYVQRAKGGCGLILSEGALVVQQGSEYPHAPGIWNEEQARAWQKITDAVHEHGALMFCQLWHLGRVAHPDMPEQKAAGKPVPGPSAIKASGGKFRDLPGQPGHVVPTPVEDPWTIVEEFKNAAKMAQKAGFDGVELHSANGYLIHQFLDHTSNQRTDMWGGSIENRCRLGLECLKVLIEVWGPARVGIKVNPGAGCNDVGMPFPDTVRTFMHYLTQVSAMKPAYVQLVRYLRKMDVPVEGMDGVFRGVPHDVLRIYGPIIKPHPSALEEHDEATYRGPAMPGPEFDSKNLTPTRLFVNGDLTPEEADKLVAEGIVDAAVFGVPWIGNPDLQKRIERGVPLNRDIDPTTFYTVPEGKDLSFGYTTYPEAKGQLPN